MARCAVRFLLCAGLLVLLPASAAAADTLLVVPFENAGRAAELDWVGESFAEALTERLAGSGRLLVPREERLAVLERLGLPLGVPLTRASLLRLAEEVGADRVVFGQFSVADSQLQARTQLLDARRLRLSPVIEERGSFAQLLDIQALLAWRILRQFDATFPLSQQAFQQRYPRRPVSAFESYIRGLLAFNREQQSRYFLQATRLDPGYTPPVFQLAHLYFEDQDYLAAARWFEKIPADDSLALDARFYLGLCYFYAHDYARATQTLALVADRLSVSVVWNNLGVFASRSRAAEEALSYFARAHEDDPDDPNIYFNLALHHLRGERWAEAARALEQCIELDPQDTEAQFLYAQALERLGQAPQAERARQQAVGDNPALLLSLERRQLDLDRLEQSFNARVLWLRRQQQETPAEANVRTQHVTMHVEKGQDLLARGQLETAQKEFTEAILLDPDSYEAHLWLADIYQRQGRANEAIAELKASLWSQETVGARLRLAEIYLGGNRLAEARQQVRAALALDPGNAAARALETRLSGQASPSHAGESRPQ